MQLDFATKNVTEANFKRSNCKQQLLRAYFNKDHESQTQWEKMPLEGQMVIKTMFLEEKL